MRKIFIYKKISIIPYFHINRKKFLQFFPNRWHLKTDMNLFHKIVSSSCNVFTWPIKKENAQDTAFELGHRLGYRGRNREALLKFLRSVPAEELAEKMNDYYLALKTVRRMIMYSQSLHFSIGYPRIFSLLLYFGLILFVIEGKKRRSILLSISTDCAKANRRSCDTGRPYFDGQTNEKDAHFNWPIGQRWSDRILFR